MKLYLPHAFTLDDGKEAVAHAAGSIHDFEKGVAELLKKRFGAVPASEAPQPDLEAKASVGPTGQPGNAQGSEPNAGGRSSEAGAGQQGGGSQPTA